MPSRRLLPLSVIVVALVCGSALAQIPDEFTNLQVLPKDMNRRELMGLMRGFAGALGVRCAHCHPGGDGQSLQGVDFATDDLETKRVARAMLKMTNEINNRLLPATGRESLVQVKCVTCHHGLQEPEPLQDLLEQTLEKDGVDAALARYAELRKEYYGSGSYDFSARTLNGIVESLARQDVDSALKVLQANIEANPDENYSYILLAQIQAQRGETAKATEAIEHVLAADPENAFAKRILEQLKARQQGE